MFEQEPLSKQEPLIENPSARPLAESPRRKRPVSERRIQANQRNSLRSTGPKTERGRGSSPATQLSMVFSREKW